VAGEPPVPSADAPAAESVEAASLDVEHTLLDVGSPVASPPPPPLEDLPPDPGMGWVSAPDAPSSEEAVPLAFEDLEPESQTSLSEPVEPLPGIVGMTESDDTSHIGPLDESVGHGFHVETSEDIVLRSSGASEFQMPNASEEFFDSAFGPPQASPQPPVEPTAEAQTEPTPEPEAAPVSEPEIRETPEPEIVNVAEPVFAHIPEPEPIVASSPAPAPSLPDLPPDPMMTESMAELLLSQGHREEALRVYRDLDGRVGGDSRLQQRIADLERPTPAPAPQRQYTAGATGGRSARDFFRTILASRPPHV